MMNTRRVSLLCSGLILALLAIVAGFILWPRELPVKFANVTDTPLKNVEVEFMGEFVSFGTIAPRSTVFGTFAIRSVWWSEEATTQCPIVRLRFGDGETLRFKYGGSPFERPIGVMSFHSGGTPKNPYVSVETVERHMIGFGYSTFSTQLSPSKTDDPR